MIVSAVCVNRAFSRPLTLGSEANCVAMKLLLLLAALLAYGESEFTRLSQVL